MRKRKEKTKISFEIDLNSSKENYELLDKILNTADNVEINHQTVFEDAVSYLDENIFRILSKNEKLDKEQCNKYLVDVIWSEEIFKMFIEAGADIKNEYIGSKCFEAATLRSVSNHTATLKRVIDAGAKVSKRSLQECIDSVVASGEIEKAKLLIDFGADIEKIPYDKLYIAVLTKKLEMLQFLVKQGLKLNKYNLWEDAVKTEDTDIIQLFIKEEAYINNPNALSIAIEAGNYSNNYNKELIARLIELGANVNQSHGLPVFLATQYCGRFEVLNLLLKSGAKVKGRGYEKAKHAIINATEIQSEEMIRLLIKEGADVTVEDNKAIIVAAETGNEKIMDILIEAGADVRANNDEALMRASAEGNLDVIKKLIKLGANIKAQNHGPIKWAGAARQDEVVKYFVELGEDEGYSKQYPSDVDVRMGDILGGPRGVFVVYRKSDRKVLYDDVM